MYRIVHVFHDPIDDSIVSVFIQKESIFVKEVIVIPGQNMLIACMQQAGAVIRDPGFQTVAAPFALIRLVISQ